MAVLVLLGLLIQTVEHIVLVVQKDAALWKVFLYMGITVVYLLTVWFWLIVPYKRSERMIQRFLEGHIIIESSDFDEVLLTPSIRRQMESFPPIRP